MLPVAGKLCLILDIPGVEPNTQALSLFSRRAQVEAYIAENGTAVFGSRGNVGEAKRDIGHAVGFKCLGRAGVNAYRTPVANRVLFFFGKR